MLLAIMESARIRSDSAKGPEKPVGSPAGATARPFLHLLNLTRRPRQSVGAISSKQVAEGAVAIGD
jgi:hypothetical protein